MPRQFKPELQPADSRLMARERRQGAHAKAAILVIALFGLASCGQSQDVAADHPSKPTPAGGSARLSERDDVDRNLGAARPPVAGRGLRDLPPDDEPRTDGGSLDDHRRRLRIPTAASARAWLERFGDVVEEEPSARP